MLAWPKNIGSLIIVNSQLSLESLEAPYVELWQASESDKGEIFTKNHIVDFMITAAGIPDSITDERTRILEPSCGQGEFMVRLAQILCEALNHLSERPSIEKLGEKLLGFEISEANLAVTRTKLKSILSDYFSAEEVDYLITSWLRHEDFLLAEIDQDFSHIVGNPPYIRVENIPKPILALYRRRFQTMTDRADIYVGFFEKGLKSLLPEGKLSFICTDRWVKNQYGRNLRALIDCDGFNVDYYLDLSGKDPFHRKVLTYPAITQISRANKTRTLVVEDESIDPRVLFEEIRSGSTTQPNRLTPREDITNGDRPWLLGSSDETSVIQRIEAQFPTLEEAGCKVFIGAATGNNKVFVVGTDVELEDDRKVPLITAKDLRKAELPDSERFLVNTYEDQGVVNLEDYPLLRDYLLQHKEALSKRHVAKGQPKRWYKTIDRVYPERARRPKLLIPDIKSELVVSYEKGKFHPNNSLYYICAETWDLRALRAVLLSGIGKLFIETYSTKVANGFLRFQAQHLRRICIPHWEEVPHEVRSALIDAGDKNNFEKAAELVKQLYRITDAESELLGI